MRHTFFAHRQGQGLTEYALVILLIAIAVVAVVSTFGQQLDATYTSIITSWP